jgi:hypothetical protein
MRGRRKLIGWARLAPVRMWNVLTHGATRLLSLSHDGKRQSKGRVRVTWVTFLCEMGPYVSASATQHVAESYKSYPVFLVPVLYEFTNKHHCSATR